MREDHLDFFKDIDDIRNSFKIFADKLDENGTLIINSAIDNLSYFTNDLKCRYITFGLDKNTSDFSAEKFPKVYIVNDITLCKNLGKYGRNIGNVEIWKHWYNIVK